MTDAGYRKSTVSEPKRFTSNTILQIVNNPQMDLFLSLGRPAIWLQGKSVHTLPLLRLVFPRLREMHEARRRHDRNLPSVPWTKSSRLEILLNSLSMTSVR